ncbi:RNA methyltransferase [Anoxybacter fermentans]|uniref:RNA methyltransferase n=1 Tax=Anoxybacter fermentans TaxID=1323375 RepID=A0A3S9SYX1_9FIRM|nr:TlyA family RNA methyltransferase [Anoxybacter fermentans]AZR73517.1 RNA methyltransferase [Anoxybacter fermentans]
MPQKIRLDQHLTEAGYFESRNKAKAAIMAGLVFVDGRRIDKPGTKIDPESEIIIKGEYCPYVSRGGFKLEKAIQVFDLDVTDYKVMDVGASTGGFTDCLLQHGARQVYAVDVGYGQLAWSLRNDPRVVVMERTNIRYLTKDDLPEIFDLVTIDVSFISLKIVIPAARQFLKPGGEMVALIKPQFEAGREKVGKKGVVKDPTIHKDVIGEIIQMVNKEDLQVVDLSYSPITGAEGHNIEFLIYLKDGLKVKGFDEAKIDRIVSKAHAELKP